MDSTKLVTLVHVPRMNAWIGWNDVHFEGYVDPNAEYFPGIGWNKAYLPKESVDAAYLMVEMEQPTDVYTPSWEWVDNGDGHLVLHSPVGWQNIHEVSRISPISVVHPDGRVVDVYPLEGAWVKV